MPEQTFRMVARKKTAIRVIDLRTGKPWKEIGANGTIMKGRGGMEARTTEDGRRVVVSEEQFFMADLFSAELGKRITVVYNPTLPSSGQEVAVNRDAPFPAEQEFKLYVVVQLELPLLVRWRYRGRLPRSFAMANKLQNPIRMKATLKREWGLEPGLRYEMQDHEIPLWPWDWENMDFFPSNPITDGPPIPAAYFLQPGDSTEMYRTWRLEGSEWVRRDA